MAESSLTQADKLRALGIRSPDQSIELDLQLFEDIKEWFKENEDGFSSFEDEAKNQGDYSSLEQYLVDNNILSSENADQFITKIQNKYDDYTAFTNDLSNYESFDEFINSFNPGSGLTGDTKDSEGDPNQGIRFHSEDGVSRAGVPVPKGTVEIYGPRVEFSQSAPAIDNPEAALSVSNFTVSNTIPQKYEVVTYSADLTNDSGYSTSFSIKLYEDDEVAASKNVEFGVGETKTVEFTQQYTVLRSFDASIMDSSTTTVTVAPAGIVRIR
jgi:hypothetical protein